VRVGHTQAQIGFERLTPSAQRIDIRVRATGEGVSVVRVGGVATRDGKVESVPAVDLRSPVARGRKGGAVRAKSLSPERRREIAKIAARARWNRKNS
jgi:hypothetical protein